MQHFDWLNLSYHCLELLRKRVRCGVLLLPLTPYRGPYRQAMQAYAAQIFHQDTVKSTTSHTSHQHCHSQHPATILSTNLSHINTKLLYQLHKHALTNQKWDFPLPTSDPMTISKLHPTDGYYGNQGHYRGFSRTSFLIWSH